MNSVVCTLFEGHFHYGVAGLINSLNTQGFNGDFYAGFRGDLPEWAQAAKTNETLLWKGAKTLVVGEKINIHFLPLETDYHLTNYKPEFLIKILEEYAKEADGIFYFDPDIVIKTNWRFFEKWMGFGVAMVHEITSNDMPPTHPVRKMWENVIAKSGKSVTRSLYSYINGGFCGVSKENIEFLYTWKTIMETGCRDFGMSMQQFKHDYDRGYEFFRQDQDAMNIAAMCSSSPISEYGPEGMDFIYGGMVMSHALGSPKAWKKKFLNSALKGSIPSLADKAYWDNANGAIKIYSKNKLRYKLAAIKIAAFIARFYKKS